MRKPIFTVRLLPTSDTRPGHRWGEVLDNDGNVIGDAQDYIYGGSGWAVHTRPYGGFVYDDEVRIVP